MCKLWVKNVPTFWKRKFLGVCWVMMSNFRLLLEFCWVSSGDKNKVQNCLLWGELWLNYRCLWVVVIELCLVMGSCGWWLWKNGWLWVVMGGGMKLWLVMRGEGGGSGSQIMAGCGWLWVVVAKLWLAVGGYGCLWMVARFTNAGYKDTIFLNAMYLTLKSKQQQKSCFVTFYWFC